MEKQFLLRQRHIKDKQTKRENESYDEFISRIIPNKIVCHVKLADLNDNMDLSRIANPSQKDNERVGKYRKAADRILAALEESEDSEFMSSREIEVNGCITVPESCTEDAFLDKFIKFVERNHWSFGGGVKTLE